ncbi:hypothetical protein [Trichlorobacter ammonificans]|uniref:Lipoprotein n=1 Tax=Trichlorobacter ammonificans TaxID=2916410 RepID=A0ABN8HG66_9BACT|nr:hypothetical protein [Trichlorobacter ammonificans]CAH2030109.1 putative Lipoprotein [Trichlorobacter ammonificans]
MRTTVVALMIAALALAGCQDKPKTEAPTQPQAAGQPAGHPPVGAPMPGAPAGDPHAGMKPADIPAGVPTKKATVVQTIDADVYTYIEAKGDDGKNVWMALPKTKVDKGASIEYPSDVPALPKFTSKTLNRTFDNILFVSGIKILK